MPRSCLAPLLLAAAALLALGAAGQEAVVAVRDGRGLRDALEDPGVSVVSVEADLTLAPHTGWPRGRPVVVDRPVSVEGPEGGAAKVFVQDLFIPGPDVDFLRADGPVAINLTNIHVVGVPVDLVTPPGLWNVTFLLNDCFLELWSNTSGPEPQLSALTRFQRPQGFPAPDGPQLTTPLSRGICEEELQQFDCPNVFDFLFLVDVAFDWNETGTVAPAGQEGVPPGVFSAMDTAAALFDVDIATVSDTAGLVEAISADGRSRLKVIVINDGIQIAQDDIDCSDEPVELTTDTIIFGGAASVPPVNLLDFAFAEGCLVVPGDITVSLTNLLLNSTQLRSVPGQNAWLDLVPFFDKSRGARVDLTNVVWNLAYEADAPLTATEVLEVLQDRDPVDGEPEEQLAELKNGSYCSDEFIGSSSACVESSQCSELSTCPDGAVAVDSISYTRGGTGYSLMSSVLITREAGTLTPAAPVPSSEPVPSPSPALEPPPVGSTGPRPSPSVPTGPASGSEGPVDAPPVNGDPPNPEDDDDIGMTASNGGQNGSSGTAVDSDNVTSNEMMEDGKKDSSGSSSAGAVVGGVVAVVTTILVCIAGICFGIRRYKRKKGKKVESQEDPKEGEKEVGAVSKDPAVQPTFTKFVAVDADKHKVVLDMETGEEGVIEDDEMMSSISDDFSEEVVKSEQETAEKLFDNIVMGDLLGQGSYGRVYKGTWNGAIVAVKVFTHTVEDERLEASIEREIQFMTELRHPNVVQQFKAGTRHVTPKSPMKRPNSDIEASGHTSSSTGIHSETYESAMQAIKSSRKASKETWMVMEYCDLGILSNAIKAGWFYTDDNRTQLNMEWVVRTAQDIARGCQYLHENRTVHGDLKPHNILLATSAYDNRRWGAKLADFGVSRRMGAVSHIYTSTVGTMAYLSPEILRDGKLSEGADIYAYGMISKCKTLKWCLHQIHMASCMGYCSTTFVI
ncbi:unnamed protein product [Ostreobium quekettii]|uniref:Protein kinase domain-containing protein n=1 Tax=Ostreobium quekettii TaxID=121088 RepID=A0A8S1JEI8_9CHLO|nr:unnamed protein product [Ostreobium quekettii]